MAKEDELPKVPDTSLQIVPDKAEANLPSNLLGNIDSIKEIQSSKDAVEEGSEHQPRARKPTEETMKEPVAATKDVLPPKEESETKRKEQQDTVPRNKQTYFGVVGATVDSNKVLLVMMTSLCLVLSVNGENFHTIDPDGVHNILSVYPIDAEYIGFFWKNDYLFAKFKYSVHVSMLNFTVNQTDDISEVLNVFVRNYDKYCPNKSSNKCKPSCRCKTEPIKPDHQDLGKQPADYEVEKRLDGKKSIIIGKPSMNSDGEKLFLYAGLVRYRPSSADHEVTLPVSAVESTGTSVSATGSGVTLSGSTKSSIGSNVSIVVVIVVAIVVVILVVFAVIVFLIYYQRKPNSNRNPHNRTKQSLLQTGQTEDDVEMGDTNSHGDNMEESSQSTQDENGVENE